MRLDQIFSLAAGAVDLLIQHLGQARQVGDDETAVGTLGTGLDTGDDAALDDPAFRGIAEITIAPDFLPLAIEATESGILGERADLAQQHLVAGQPEDVADPMALAPHHRLGAAVMCISSDLI